MHSKIASVLWVTAGVCAALGQEVAHQGPDVLWLGGSPARRKLPEAYQREAVSLIVREANQIAQALQLVEALPITASNLTEHYLSPLRYAEENGAIGNITTKNYTYCVSHDNKLCYVIGLRQEESIQRWEVDYSWPRSRMDTNGAYQLATQWLAAASVDVARLNHTYRLVVEAEQSYRKSDHFIPVYWVYWAPNGKGSGSIASIRLFAPTKTLMQLRVENPNYILRQPVTFTNLQNLLSEPESKNTQSR